MEPPHHHQQHRPEVDLDPADFITDEEFEKRFGPIHNRNQPRPRGEPPAPQMSNPNPNPYLYAPRYEGEYPPGFPMDVGQGGYGYEQYGQRPFQGEGYGGGEGYARPVVPGFGYEGNSYGNQRKFPLSLFRVTS
jgi:hypothetical protein